MDPTEMAFFSSLFHLPAGIAVTSLHPSASELVIGVACHTTSMPCPQCHQPSARIHGRYQRTVNDVPCGGRTVVLRLGVRKFFCRTATCPRVRQPCLTSFSLIHTVFAIPSVWEHDFPVRAFPSVLSVPLHSLPLWDLSASSDR